MKKILFPFQVGSSQNKEAFIVAIKFARNLNAELILLNSFEIKLDNNITKEVYNKRIKEKWILAYNEVSMLNHYYISNYANIKGELKVRFDHRFIYEDEIKQVLSIVENEVIDMIILPYGEQKSNHKKISHIVYNNVFKNNSTSILLIPSQYKYRPINKIVYATDLKDHYLYKFYLNEVVKYANIFNASIHFFHVDDSGTEEMKFNSEVFKTISNLIKLNKEHTYNMVSSKKVSSAIIEYVEEQNIDLISVIKEDDNFWNHLFQKSTSKEVIKASPVPVLYMVEKLGLD